MAQVIEEKKLDRFLILFAIKYHSRFDFKKNRTIQIHLWYNMARKSFAFYTEGGPLFWTLLQYPHKQIPTIHINK